jgi:hypothetical protein
MGTPTSRRSAAVKWKELRGRIARWLGRVAGNAVRRMGRRTIAPVPVLVRDYGQRRRKRDAGGFANRFNTR